MRPAIQVMLSIQSMILIAQPYFNEPGFEQSAHRPAVQFQSGQYNQRVREANIQHAIMGNMADPPVALRRFILTHAALKRDAILDTVKEWIDAPALISPEEQDSRSLPKFGDANTSLHTTTLRKLLFLLVI